MAVVATGFFDGVHLGHRLVIDTLLHEAESRGEESVVVTFWPHPRTIFQDDARALRLLSSMDEKRSLLLEMGVDRVEVLPFSAEFGAMSAFDYFSSVVRDRFGASAVVLGYDNRIGSDCLYGQAAAEAARKAGLDVVAVPEYDSAKISSTRIRELLSRGEVDVAADLLGRPYLLRGVVVAGNRVGRTLGFPTANMQLYDPLKQIPGAGAYLTRVTLHDGRRFFGMSSVGVRPTLGDGRGLTVETNIFNFDSDIYGLDMSVEFLRKIRDEKCFDSVDSLKSQLAFDKETCLNMIVS